MNLDDKVLARGFGVQSFSSSSQNTPDQKDDSYDAQIGEEILQQNYKSTSKQDLLHTCVDKERKFSSSNCKIAYQHVKTKSMKGCRIQESKRTLTHIQMASTKQQRKGINPIRHQPPTELSPDVDSPNNWICKNSACRAVLTLDDIFCKRCSCCICHLFDDNKDPSLWLVCSCEFGEVDSCGLSCHLECALQQQKVGVVDLGQLMQLDGSYCCASCGKISGILGCWKKQLVMAKDARRVDVLCYRISLCYRLLEGTSRFKELHEIVVDAKAKLETEVGPVNGVSAKMARGIVSRLSVAGDVQKLCSLAIEKADEWLDTIANAPDLVDSHPAACRFQFEELTSSSLVIVLKEPSSASSDAIKGYKLWYCKSRNESHAKEPICVFPRAQRRILISNLQPCTEYNFRIVSYSEAGDLGHSEAKCFTKSVEILRKQTESTEEFNPKICVYGGSSTKKEPKFTEAVGSSGFKVRDLGKILRIAWAQEEGCFDGFCSADGEEECGGRNSAGAPETTFEDHPPYVANNFDLNVASVPDLNAEVIPIEYSGDDIECTSDQHEDDVVSNGTEKKHIMTSNGSDDSQTWLVKQIKGLPTVESRSGLCRKRISSNDEEAYGCDSVLMNASSLRLSSGRNHLDGSYEYCVKIIRWLECKGHIQQEFRMKFLTWFSLRSTEQERKVVNTFIQTLIDDPSSLAGQLVDSFLDIISGKRLRSGFCSKLWH